MIRRVIGIAGTFLTLAAVLWTLSGCATMPRVVQGSRDYLAKGVVSEKLKGKSFYMAIGQADLYRYKMFGGVAPVGQTLDVAAAIEVDPETGQIERILTIQPPGRNVALIEPARAQMEAESGTGGYVSGDLIGGISVTDIHPYATWLEALDAMRKAVDDLRGYEPFYAPSPQPTTVVVEQQPWISGWWWGWGGYPFYRGHSGFRR